MKLKLFAAAAALAVSGVASAATPFVEGALLTVDTYTLSGTGDKSFSFKLDDKFTADAIFSFSLTGVELGDPVASIKFDGNAFAKKAGYSDGLAFAYYVYNVAALPVGASTHVITVDLLDTAQTQTYSGSLTLTYVGGTDPTPVPEPESYALALAGLGVVGMLSRRRKAA